ncbi:MAG: PqqD family protein [Terriglobales bacterium]
MGNSTLGTGDDVIAEKYIARSSTIAARLIGGEMMIMSAVDSTFFTLNEVATAIWQAADGRTPLSDIVARRICQEFEVEAEQAGRDAEQFVSDLSQHGILLVSEKPITNSPASPPEAQ